MNEEARRKNYDRMMNLTHWLNEGANLYWSSKKKKYQPCPKARLARELFNQDKQPVEIWNAVVYHELCSCHNTDFTIETAMSMWLDDSAKTRHQP